MANFNIDKTELDRMGRGFKITRDSLKQLNQKLNDNLPKKILKVLQASTPEDTGTTKGLWKINRKGSKGFEILNKNGAVIEFLIKGTVPHLIEPKNRSVLKIQLPGSVIFTKFANHPGYPSQINESELFEKISKIIDKETSRILTVILKKGMK